MLPEIGPNVIQHASQAFSLAGPVLHIDRRWGSTYSSSATRVLHFSAIHLSR